MQSLSTVKSPSPPKAQPRPAQSNRRCYKNEPQDDPNPVSFDRDHALKVVKDTCASGSGGDGVFAGIEDGKDGIQITTKALKKDKKSHTQDTKQCKHDFTTVMDNCRFFSSAIGVHHIKVCG